MSNADTITFSKAAGAIITEDIAAISYQANGAAATSGTAIPSDPGATKKFAFVLTLDAAENTTISERTQKITAPTKGTAGRFGRDDRCNDQHHVQGIVTFQTLSSRRQGDLPPGTIKNEYGY